ELEHAVMAVAVVRELVCEPATCRRGHLVDLAAEGGDGVLEPFAHGAEAFLVGGRRKEIHELVGAHSVRRPFHGFAAALCSGAKRRSGTIPRRSGTLYGMDRTAASRWSARHGSELARR